MLYRVSRNGQMYGPYTLEDLRRYVLSGNILPTDLAKNDAMTDWLNVQQVLDAVGPEAPPGAGAATAAGSSTVAPVYPPAGYPKSSVNAFPDPPNLSWILVLLFNVLSCGLFLIVWNIIIAAWMRRVYPASVALFFYIGAAVLSLSGSGSFFALQHHHHGYGHHPFAGIVVLASWVARLIARFSLRADLERHYSGPEPLGLRLSGVLTFFFGGLYIQSQLNRINDIKNSIRFRGAVR